MDTTDCLRCDGTGSGGWSYEGGSQIGNGDCDKCKGSGVITTETDNDEE